MDNIWYLKKDRRKETTETQDIEHKVTQDSAPGPKSLQDERQEGEEEHLKWRKILTDELAGEAEHAAARWEISAV